MDIIDNVTVPMMLTNGIYEKSFQPAAAKIKEFPAIRVADLLAATQLILRPPMNLTKQC